MNFRFHRFGRDHFGPLAQILSDSSLSYDDGGALEALERDVKRTQEALGATLQMLLDKGIIPAEQAVSIAHGDDVNYVEVIP